MARNVKTWGLVGRIRRLRRYPALNAPDSGVH